MTAFIPRNARRPTIWVVDDSPLEAEYVRRSLASAYDVEVFADGAFFIEQLTEKAPPDAVVLDWEMPGVGGLEICQLVRSNEATQALPLLVLTVHRQTADLVRCLAAGADDFLSKPCNPAELTARLAALMRTKQMHERLEAAERDMRQLLMQLPDAVISVARDGRVTFANVEAERMLGTKATDVIERPLREVLPGFRITLDPVDADDAAGSLPDLVLGDRVYAPVVRRIGGALASDTTFSFREVTADRRHDGERARLLEAERSARAQAEAANLAKDEFLAVVSHELRTPLNAMLGWLRLLREGSLDPAKRERALATVERNAVAQQKLIEDILDVTRIISGKLTIDRVVLDLGPVVRAAAEAVRPEAEKKNIAFHLDVEGALPVSGDAARLQQLVANLLTNAVKFTPGGGAVTVDALVDGGVAVVRVLDTGVGIEPEFLPHVFERFRQADSSTTRTQGGLGLGLSIVRQIAELHGGTIEARSPGRAKGASFTVRIPLATSAAVARGPGAPATSPEVPPQSSKALEGVSVLVVDDQSDSREFAVEVLAAHGARAVAVTSVSEAVEALQAMRPDVVVSDIGMPEQDGFALAEHLRATDAARGSHLPAIALTAYASPQDQMRALASGFDAHVQKPVAPDVLVLAVSSLVRRARK
ncbi:MAG TPA: response regulator [Polyangiaceae bacterium]|jgi:signal transduction histidine kinase